MLLVFILAILFAQSPLVGIEKLQITKADEITYEWLVDQRNPNYSHHVHHFKKIFELLKPKTFLEFGLGFSTKYFLDNSQKVISVEVITNGYGPGVLRSYLDLYRDSSNWIPIAFFSGYPGDMSWAPYKYDGSESVYKAISYQCATHQNYALIDDFYLKELNSFVENLFKCHRINITFVNPGMFLRGDLVQLLFNKSPVIVANDTSMRSSGIKDDVYGYSRIKTPDNYEEIYLYGMTVWVVINESTKNFIKDLKEYAKTL